MNKTIFRIIIVAICLLVMSFALCACESLMPSVEINADGYWVINGKVTDVLAAGQDGTTPTVTVNEDGYFVINGIVTGIKEVEEDTVAYNVSALNVGVDTPVVQLQFEVTDWSEFEGYTDFKASFYYKNRLISETSFDPAKGVIVEKVCFGFVDYKITAKNAKGEAETICSDVIGVGADEYNIVSMNGSMPVLYFTLHMLSMDGDTRDNYAGHSLPVIEKAPTIIALERENSYNWNALPENTYWLPSQEKPTGDFHGNNAIMAAYIKELYTINPNTKFNFYCVDNYPELILQFFVAQGITNYDAVMVSDGTGTVSYFKNMTNPDVSLGLTPDEMFSKMASEWVRIKTEAANGSDTYLKDVFVGNNQGWQILANYAFVIATLEENVEWWCTREALLVDNSNSAYIKDLLKGTNDSGKNVNLEKTNVIYPGLGNMLKYLSTSDSMALKNLYKFSDEVFASAGDKECLVVLGTSQSSEGDLENYLKYLKATYGETHQIYYKGHPGWPTALYPERLEMFDELGIVDIESYIAAEIILFYCPDIYLAGYQSSTFYSAQADKVEVLFMSEAYRNANVDTVPYAAKVYISPVSAHGDIYTEYAGCYVIESGLSDQVDIYNPTTGAVTNVVPATP